MNHSETLINEIDKLFEQSSSFITADAGAAPNTSHPGEPGARFSSLNRAKRVAGEQQADLHANGVNHGMHVHEISHVNGHNVIKSTHTLTPAGKWHHHTKFAGKTIASPHHDAEF